MNLRVYSLRDSKVLSFAPPFCCQTEAQAIRMVGDLINGDLQSPVAKHPDDFELFFLGVWDDDTGVS